MLKPTIRQALIYAITFAWLIIPQAVSQVPATPVLYQVTVDPETGYDVISWYPSPSGNVDHYVIALSTLVNPQEPYVLSPIGQSLGTDTVYVNRNTESAGKSIGYTVYAVNVVMPDSTYNSLFSPPDSTLFAGAVFDSCQGTISLTWNDYNTWRGQVKEFSVNQRLGPGLYLELARLTEGTRQYSLSPVEENTSYQLFIQAVHNDNVRRSSSNLVTVVTAMARVPDTITADYANYGGANSVNLSFTIDPASSLENYRILRASAPDGPYDTVTELHTPDKVIRFTDAVAFADEIHYYKLVAYNNCERPVMASGITHTLLLTGRAENEVITLEWNAYTGWNGGVAAYTVYREYGGQVDSIEAGLATTISENFSTLVDPGSPRNSQVCYQVVASASLQGGGNTSRSNPVCLNLHPEVFLPNAFIPNSDDGINDRFGPVFSFLPERYELTIFNRAGSNIWTGSGPWNGWINGKPATEGVYLYHLKVYNFGDPVQEFTGSVAVVYR